MPDLGWDATEELETQDVLSTTIENTEEIANTVQVLPGTITAIAILILAFLETLKPQLQELLQIGKKTAKAVLIMTRTMNCNGVLKRINKTYRKAVQAITHTTRMTSDNTSTNHRKTGNRNQAQTANRATKQKLNNDCDRLYQLYYTPTP